MSPILTEFSGKALPELSEEHLSVRSPFLWANIYAPEEVRQLCGKGPSGTPTWAVEFRDPQSDSVLVVASKAAPELGKQSDPTFVWGGFRILSPSLMSGDFSQIGMAANLATEMEGKLQYVQALDLGGPLGKALIETGKIVGGKCVFLPGPGCEIGGPNDTAALSFAAGCLRSLSEKSNLTCLTGQDLNHGLMSNGERSLTFLNRGFKFCVDLATATPTAWGEAALTQGIARAQGVDLSKASVSLLGCGGIGRVLLQEMLDRGTGDIAVYDIDPTKREEVRRAFEGNPSVTVVESKEALLARPADYLLVNAEKYSLDPPTVDRIARHQSGMRAIIGAENLILPPGTEAESQLRFLVKGIDLYPPQLVGVWGGLAALEAGLTLARGETFDLKKFRSHTEGHQAIGERTARYLASSPFVNTVSEAVEATRSAHSAVRRDSEMELRLATQ